MTVMSELRRPRWSIWHWAALACWVLAAVNALAWIDFRGSLAPSLLILIALGAGLSLVASRTRACLGCGTRAPRYARICLRCHREFDSTTSSGRS